jgi:hypothetical protein
MKRAFAIGLLALGLASAPAASFTPGNVVVVQCAGVATTGNAGSLIEVPAAGGAPVQSVPLSGIVFGSSVALVHGQSLSADGALIIIPGYAATATGIESTTAAADNRVMAMAKWDGTCAYYTNSAFASGASVRGAASDGLGNFWGVFTSGMRYLSVTAPGTSTTVVNTGSRACGIFNGQLYASVSAAVDSVSPNLPTGSGSYSTYFSGVANVNVFGFVLPPGPTVGATAYVGNYQSTPTAIYAYTWSGSAWSAAYTLTFSGIGNPQHLAVDYSQSPAVIYFTTTSGVNNSLYRLVDPQATGTYTPTALYTASGGALLRGVSMAPTRPPAPVCSVAPNSVSVNPGDTAIFGPVSATGANPNAYTWKVDYGSGKVALTNGPTGHGSAVAGGATTAALGITNVAAGDAGSYYVEANNNSGTTVECGPGVLGFYPSCLTTALLSITNVAASTASFSVASGIGGCSAPLTYFWSKNGGGLTDGPTGSGSMISGSSTATLTITGVQDGDGDGNPGAPGTSGSTATYSVTVYDINATPNISSAILTLLDTPVFTTQPANQNKAVGQTANFTVAATGGSLSYLWFKSPSSVPLANGASGNGSTLSGATTAHLVITGVQTGDAGSYSAMATNLAGSTPSNPATLTVGVVPTVSPLSDSFALLGSDAVFGATVTAGTPPFTYTWKHNGAVLSNDGVHIFGADTATLGITNVSQDDRRLYSLSVSNAYGGTTVSAMLYVILSTSQPNDVPNLIVYEPFDYPTGPNPAVGFYSWEGLVSIYNRVTGAPVHWMNTGGGLFTAVAAWDPSSLYTSAARNGGLYPYPGIDCAARNRWTFSSSTCNNHLAFGGVTNGSAYFSFVFTGDQGGIVDNSTYDVLAGFTSGTSDLSGANANNFAYALCSRADDPPGEPNPGNVDGPGGWRFGVFKGGGISIGSASVNGQFASRHLVRGHPYLIVGCYKINSGGTSTNDDVLSLWVEPALTSFGASEANVPTPDAGGMRTNWNANAPITEFAIRATLNTAPFSKSISDLRIGKTWASVTGPYYPRLTQAVSLPTVALEWPAKDSFGGYGYQLRTSPDLVNWGPDGNAPFTDFTGTTNIVSETPAGNQFWQLLYPPRSGNYGQY